MGRSSLSPLPFKSSASNFPVLTPSSSLPPAATVARDLALTDLDLVSSREPPEVNPRTPWISAIGSASSRLVLGSAEPTHTSVNPNSAEVKEVFAGPNLFVDGDGIEYQWFAGNILKPTAEQMLRTLYAHCDRAILWTSCNHQFARLWYND